MVRPSDVRFRAKKNCMKRELGTVNNEQAKFEKTSSKEYHNWETAKSDGSEQIEKKSNDCSVKSGQLRVASLVLEEQLEVANKKITLGSYLQTWPWYSNEKWNHMEMQWKKTCYSCFRHHVTIRTVSEAIKSMGKYTAIVCLAVI